MHNLLERERERERGRDYSRFFICPPTHTHTHSRIFLEVTFNDSVDQPLGELHNFLLLSSLATWSEGWGYVKGGKCEGWGCVRSGDVRGYG